MKQTNANTGMPAQSPMYDPAVALEFFKSGGKAGRVEQGTKFFAENQKGRRILLQSDKMYLLLQGEVGLIANNKAIGGVKAGEIFGELTAISQSPRSATAIAKTPCRVIALDEGQFRKALARKPRFALMFMSIMISRLRETIRRLKASRALTKEGAWKESAAFDQELLADLVRGLTDEPPVHFDRGRPIVKEGQSGIRMYAVLEGRVAVSVGESVVERLGPGGVFGEIALLEQAPRLASAVAETDCSLLPINRNAFLALVKTSPEFAETMLRSLAERIRLLTSRLKKSA
ncbi:MAG: cyclic nucleotide-binding domain-containing protein [Betaproteobacteria bacterium]|nr:cyclic nucleotide-binding domain-containing protein [Betaproteobacteria bacterium]